MQKVKRFNLRPAVFAAVSACLGAISAYNFIFESVLIAIVCIFLFLLLGAAVFLPFNREFSIKGKIILCMVITALFLICGLGFNSSVKDYENASVSGNYYSVTAHVSKCEQLTYGKRLLLEDITIKGANGGKLKYKASVVVNGVSDIDLGDNITFFATLQNNSLIYENEFSVYNLIYKTKYAAKVNADEVTVIGNNPTVFESANIFIRDALDSALDKDEFSVAYAMLTGSDEQIDYELLDSYRYAGVAHIFAVSGLHIGFLATALSFVFDKLKVNRFVKAVTISLALFFYSGICGFSASSIRAAVMTTVMLFSAIKGDRYDGLSSISLAAILLLIFSPAQVFSVGFQLSFVVVLGMMLLTKPIRKALKFLPEKVASSIAVALSAQISSIPICLDNFGYFSPIAVLVNVIFIPVASVIFIALLIAVIIGGLLNIANVTLFLPKHALRLINLGLGVVDFEGLIVGGFSFAALTIAYYLACVLSSDYLNLKRLTRIISTSLCVIICIVGTIIVANFENSKTKVFVIGSDNLSVTVVDAEEENLLFVSDANYWFSVNRLKRLSDKHGVKNIDTVVFFNDNSIDEQVILTKLRTIFDIKRVCYYGERDQMKENIIEKSFGIEAYNFTDGQNISSSEICCEFGIDGKAAILEVKGRRFGVFSFADGLTYDGLEGEFDVMVCSIEAELALNYYNPAYPVSYRASSNFINGESNGTAIIEFI